MNHCVAVHIICESVYDKLTMSYTCSNTSITQHNYNNYLASPFSGKRLRKLSMYKDALIVID